MDEITKQQLEKYDKYKIKSASHWMFWIRDDDEYCRIDGICDDEQEIMVIGLDYQSARKLKEYIEQYLRRYERKYCYLG